MEKALERIIGNTLGVMGLSRKPRRQIALATEYKLDFLNPDQDLEKLTTGLKRCPNARLCLYGEPGSGKTAFGHYLAKKLDKPLLIKQASDLLSKWVGEAEQNIAAMFDEAEADDMVVLLDEADSFLRDRVHSHHSWEVTQVNELLVQMEAFEGLFIASTNLVESLDMASLRRFDHKIKFDFMKPEQVWDLFVQVLGEHNQARPKANDIKTQLAQWHTLTPGDFATVVRQARSLDQILDATTLLESLKKECQTKDRQSNPIGFVLP